MSVVVGATGTAYSVDETPLGSGGQSVLYPCTDPSGTARVFKKYTTPIAHNEHDGWLTSLVTHGRAVLRASNGSVTAARSSINWPLDLIRAEDHIVGVILPLIPSEFILSETKPRTIEYLCLAATNPPKADVRVGVLIRACDIFAYLEGEGLVHGDLSPKNLVWRPPTKTQDSHAYLIDCDGMRPVDSSGARAVGTEGWKDPRWITGKIAVHDHYSDRFALAVLIYRGLLLNPGAPNMAAGQWTGASGIPTDLDPGMASLFDKAFADPFATAERPTAAQWRAGLVAAYLTSDGNGFRTGALAQVDRYADRFRDSGQIDPPRSLPEPDSGPAQTPDSGTNPKASNWAWWLPGLIAITVAVLVIILGNVSADEQHRNPPIQVTTTYAAHSSAAPIPTSPDDRTIEQLNAVAAILEQSAATRRTVAKAVADVGNCRGVFDAYLQLTGAAADRDWQHRTALALDMSAVNAGGALKDDLAAALQSSFWADTNFAAWAHTVTASCEATSASSTAYQLAQAYSLDASASKRAFCARWNSLASRYTGLPFYDESDI